MLTSTVTMAMVLQLIEMLQKEDTVYNARVVDTEDRAWSTEDLCIKALPTTPRKCNNNRLSDEDTSYDVVAVEYTYKVPISGIQRTQNTHVELASRDAHGVSRIEVDSVPRRFTLLWKA